MIIPVTIKSGSRIINVAFNDLLHAITYSLVISALDEGVGKVVNTLKQAGMYNNTLIVFSTDNGGQQLRGSSNYPLRGNKDTMYEAGKDIFRSCPLYFSYAWREIVRNYLAGIRGVGLVSGPLLQREGAVNKELMHMTDWMPTLLHLAGGNASHLDVDGIDQWNSLSTGAPSLREVGLTRSTCYYILWILWYLQGISHARRYFTT